MAIFLLLGSTSFKLVGRPVGGDFGGAVDDLTGGCGEATGIGAVFCFLLCGS